MLKLFRLASMAKILLSLYLVLANGWCAATCIIVSCEPLAHDENAAPPCHKIPSGGDQTPDGQDDDTNCSHQMVSLAEAATVKPANLVGDSFDHAVVSDSFVSPTLALTEVRILPFYQLPFFRPRGTSILRI